MPSCILVAVNRQQSVFVEQAFIDGSLGARYYAHLWESVGN